MMHSYLAEVGKKWISFFVAIVLLFSFLPVGNSAIARAKETQQKDKYPYFLQVNKGTNVVTVYGKDSKGKYTVAVKAFVCSTGNDTPLGTYKTPNRYRWQPLMDDVWGQYCTQIVGNILFHSVYYMTQNPADLNVHAYNQLGTTASHGCVRLTCGDAKWIYDNCALGTTVKIINGTAKNDPLGKPKAMKISTKWDPTDPAPQNPWHNRELKISVTKSTSLEYGTKVKNLKSYVTVTDVCGATVNKSKYLTVEGKVNTKKLGTYEVTYTTKDKVGKVKTKVVKFKVVDTKKPLLSGVENITIERNSPFDPYEGVSAKMRSGKVLKQKKIKISGAKVNSSVIGVYRLTYQVTGTNKKTVKKVRKVTVADTQAPLVESISDTVLEGAYASLTEEQKIEQIKADVSGKLKVIDNGAVVTDPAKMTSITAVSNDGSNYIVTVTVRDIAKNQTVITCNYTLKDTSTS
ncbi:MAG: DUF5011 domain-containing protein [Lachnospira sp.]|nr:DUF5011 domain-containing protein [Lachnospira sp.]